MNTEQAKGPGRPTLTDEGPCTRDGYTINEELLAKFKAKLKRKKVNKSKLFRGWIEWFLEEEE